MYPIILHIIKNFIVVYLSGVIAEIWINIGLFGGITIVCLCGIGIYLIWKSIDIKLFSLKGINHI